MYELTHFIACEVFRNNCNPYSLDDKVNRDKFSELIKELSNIKDNINWIIARAFHENYKSCEWGRELIVCVPQVIAYYKRGAASEILSESKYKSLLNYYKEVFLPAVVQHAENVERRALKNWEKEWFKETKKTQLTLKK